MQNVGGAGFNSEIPARRTRALAGGRIPCLPACPEPNMVQGRQVNSEIRIPLQ